MKNESTAFDWQRETNQRRGREANTDLGVRGLRGRSWTRSRSSLKVGAVIFGPSSPLHISNPTFFLFLFSNPLPFFWLRRFFLPTSSRGRFDSHTFLFSIWSSTLSRPTLGDLPFTFLFASPPPSCLTLSSPISDLFLLYVPFFPQYYSWQRNLSRTKTYC